jgi:hypothetical protein
MSNGGLRVRRDQASWAYIYIALGFALSIEGTIIQLITPLKFPWNLIAYLVVGFLTGYAFIKSAWVQNKLIGLKNRYEDKYR